MHTNFQPLLLLTVVMTNFTVLGAIPASAARATSNCVEASESEAPTTADAEDWTFGGTWPYEPHWFTTAEGTLHYIDEGPQAGRPVVLVHGNPTWGYIWRNFIPALVNAGFRVIVPDHLGFGRSEKPREPSNYKVQKHAARLEALLDSLELEDATIVCHDWGGPIGLAWAARHPDQIHSLVILNTLVHRPATLVQMPFSLRISRAPVAGPLLVKGVHASIRVFMFHRGLIKAQRLGADERAAYLAPNPTWPSRTSIMVFLRELPSGPEGDVSDFLGEVHQGLMALRSRPVFIVWGMKDFTFRPTDLDDKWLVDFPKAKVLRLPEAAHFVQEDAHETIVPSLIEFLKNGY